MNKEIVRDNLNKILTNFINWDNLYDPKTIEETWDMLDYKMSIIFLNMWVQDLKKFARDALKELDE